MAARKTARSSRQAVLYRRVSTAKQGRADDGGWSLAAQEKRLAEYCREQGFRIAAEFEEEESASKVGRPVFAKMVRQIRKDPSAFVLVVEKLDRLGRNLRDFVDIEDLVHAGLEVHFAKDRQIIDRDSPPAVWLTNDISMAVARNYSKNLSREVKKGMSARAEAGYFANGCPPPGYRMQPKPSGKRAKVNIEADPTTAPIVRGIFDRAATGEWTLRSLAEWAEEQGLVGRFGARLSGTVVRDMLSNKTFTGQWIRHKREWIPAKHEPLVSVQLFEEVQVALAKRGTGGYRKRSVRHVRAYSSLLQCHYCGGPITYYYKPAQPERGRTKDYESWMCNDKKNCDNRKYILQSEIDDAMVEVLEQLRIPEELSEMAVALAKESLGKDLNTDEVAPLEKELAKKQKAYGRIVDELISGEFDRSALLAKQDQLKSAIHDLENRLAEARRERATQVTHLDLVMQTLSLAKELPALFRRATEGERREMLGLLLESSGTDRSRWDFRTLKIEPRWRSPWGEIANLKRSRKPSDSTSGDQQASGTSRIRKNGGESRGSVRRDPATPVLMDTIRAIIRYGDEFGAPVLRLAAE